jgi:Stage III sporulation protein AB (spore_III_AB).
MGLSARLKARQLALRKLKDIILFMENEICVLGRPLNKVFEELAKGSYGGVWRPVFERSGSMLKEQSMDAGTAWRIALGEAAVSLPLAGEDMDILRDFGELLGKSDRQMQQAVLDMEKEKIAAMELKAKEAAETNGKLYRNLGALLGAALVILLI